MPPSSLLRLPNEVIIVILEHLHPEKYEQLDWRTATVHCDSPKASDIGIYSVRAVCRRLCELATPLAFRHLRFWTANHAITNADPFIADEQIFNAARTLRLRFDRNTHTFGIIARNRISSFLPRLTNVADLHIQGYTSVGESLLNSIAQLHTLKHLWISCLTDEDAVLDVPALKDVSLESLSICGVTRFADPEYAFRNTKQIYRPIISLLSGSTSKSLRFLHIRRASEDRLPRLNFSLASPLQRLEDIIPVDVNFPSLEVLKFDGVDSAPYWLGRRSEDFPKLHTFMFGNDPIPKVASPTSLGWPQLRSLHVGRLHADENLVATCGNLTELHISSPMDQENLEELRETLRTRKNNNPTSSLQSLSLCLLLRPGVVAMPVSLEHISEFFDCTQDLKKLSIMSSSEMSIELWNYHQDNLLRAFSKLKQLRCLRTNLFPAPAKGSPVPEEVYFESEDEETLLEISQKIAKLCPKLETLFCISKKHKSCRNIHIQRCEDATAECLVVPVTMEKKRNCIGDDCAFYTSLQI